MSEQCLFCDEQTNGEDTFIESELWRARWDQYPATPGHAEVVPKRHVQYLDELTAEELSSMMAFVREVMGTIRTTNLVGLYESLLRAATDNNRSLQQRALANANQRANPPDAFNIGINDGPAAGQSVHHLHMHLMPRWFSDVENPRGGVRNLFPSDEYKNL